LKFHYCARDCQFEFVHKRQQSMRSASESNDIVQTLQLKQTSIKISPYCNLLVYA